MISFLARIQDCAWTTTSALNRARDRYSSSASRFLKDCRGSVAPIMAIAALPLLGAVGAAVDYGGALSARTAMQNALDSTAIALVKPNASGSQYTGQGQEFFTALFVHPQVQNLSFGADVNDGASTSAVTLNASGAFKTTFMGMMGFSTIDISARSSAVMTTDSSGCVLALNSTEAGAVAVSGNSNIALNGCSLYSNSKDIASLTVGGSATLSAQSIGVVGKAALSGGNVTTTEGIRTGLNPLADPYSDINFPSFVGCTKTNLSIKTTITISPGVYCNGLTVNADANLTLSPGIYYLDRGRFLVNGGGTVSGDGVTLVFTSSTGSNWATATISGNANINLTAPIAGPTAGIVVFGDRQMPVGTEFKFNGGASQYFGGAMYLPRGAIDFSGGMGTSTNCTQIIGDTVNFTGNSKVAINCSSLKTKPFGSTVLKLTS